MTKGKGPGQGRPLASQPLAASRRSTQIKTYSWDNAQVLLVGNKCDMEDERVVSSERGRQLADHLGEYPQDCSPHRAGPGPRPRPPHTLEIGHERDPGGSHL